MRDRFIEAALLRAQAAQGEAGSRFQSRRLVLAREVERLLQIRAGVCELAAREQRVREVDQTVGGERSTVEALRGLDRVSGDRLGARGVARRVVQVAEL